MATLDQRNQKNPQEGDTWGGGAYYNGGLGYIIPAGYVYNNGQWVSPLTAQTNNIASQKLRYEADSAATKAAADKASYLAQLQNQQVASTAGNKLNALLQNPESVSSTPGYQFAYNQGLEAVNRTAAAKGQLGSGNRLYDLTKFGQGLASQTYNSTVSQLSNLLNRSQSPEYSMESYNTKSSGTPKPLYYGGMGG